MKMSDLIDGTILKKEIWSSLRPKDFSLNETKKINKSTRKFTMSVFSSNRYYKTTNKQGQCFHFFCEKRI
jgi:hypothetical protein